MQREVEELKIFEILEQRAANSSFCSTSSVIARLMDGSVNSTPVKSYQNENRVLPSKSSDFAEELVSKNNRMSNKDSIIGYLPFGLDTKEAVESVENAGAYASNIRLTVENNCKDGGNNALSDRNLHVRFSEQNEYKTVSDGSFSSQDDSRRNSDCNSRLEKNRSFQDDQAWSDCSCASSTSPNTSNISTLCSSPEPRPVLNQQYDVHSVMTKSGIYPASLDKEPICITNNSKHKITSKVDIGVNTQNNGVLDLMEKNSLLKTRLDELEEEIKIFRKENTKLHNLKKEHEEEVAKYKKEKKEFERNMKLEKEKLESRLQEERKKLQKEKSVFERYCKDLKEQPTKQEREEIQALKQQVIKF